MLATVLATVLRRLAVALDTRVMVEMAGDNADADAGADADDVTDPAAVVADAAAAGAAWAARLNNIDDLNEAKECGGEDGLGWVCMCVLA